MITQHLSWGDRERQRQTDRHRQTDRETGTDTERDRDKQTDRQTNKQTDKDREIYRESSEQFKDGIYALEKARMRSTLSVRSFPIVAFETVPMSVRQYRLALPLSTPLSSR